MRACLRQFLADDRGAVTLEWLSLSVAAVGAGVLAARLVGYATADVSAELKAVLLAARFDGVAVVEPSSGSASASSGAADE